MKRLLALCVACFVPLSAGAYVITAGQMFGPREDNPAGARLLLEMEGVSVESLKREFELGRGLTTAGLRTGTQWVCLQSSLSTFVNHERSSSSSILTDPSPPYYHRFTDRVDAATVKFDVGNSGMWPSFLAVYSSEYGMHISYSAGPLVARQAAIGGELYFSGSASDRGQYGNEWYIEAGVNVRASRLGKGLVLHYVGNYQESFKGRMLKQRSVEGYALCPWTLRR